LPLQSGGSVAAMMGHQAVRAGQILRLRQAGAERRDEVRRRPVEVRPAGHDRPERAGPRPPTGVALRVRPVLSTQCRAPGHRRAGLHGGVLGPSPRNPSARLPPCSSASSVVHPLVLFGGWFSRRNRASGSARIVVAMRARNARRRGRADLPPFGECDLSRPAETRFGKWPFADQKIPRAVSANGSAQTFVDSRAKRSYR